MCPRPRLCRICGGARQPECRYCPRCKKLIGHNETAARVAALKAAWSETHRGFLCFYTGVLLSEEDVMDPWYLTFDHYIPGRKGTLVVCASFINQMKTSLSGDEFWCVVMEYDSHRKGAPFHKDVVDFLYWMRFPAPVPRPQPVIPAPAGPGGRKCAVCGDAAFGRAKYCPRCRRKDPNIPGRSRAMTASWSPQYRRFMDHYIDVALEEYDLSDPFYMCFDHRIPGRKADLVATSMLMNSMKGELSDREFGLLMNELARSREGGPFRRDIIKFEYWTRW